MRYQQSEEELWWGEPPIDSPEYNQRIERQAIWREQWANYRGDDHTDDDSWGENRVVNRV